MRDQLEITYRGTVQLLDVEKIAYIKSDNVYVEIFTDDTRYLQRKFLGQLSAELPEHFVRVHRSYLVNSTKITGRSRTHLMIEDRKIPLSRAFSLDGLEELSAN